MGGQTGMMLQMATSKKLLVVLPSSSSLQMWSGLMTTTWSFDQKITTETHGFLSSGSIVSIVDSKAIPRKTANTIEHVAVSTDTNNYKLRV